MKFYHVDLCRKEITKEFNPRVPKYVLDDENKNIPRVCVSRSIEGALGSVPWGGCKMVNKGENMIFRVYEFELSETDSDSIITPDILVRKGYVPDASSHKEHWILKDIKPSNVYNIIIEYFKERGEEYFTSSFYELSSEDFKDESFDVKDFYLGTSTVIYNLKYTVVKDEDVIFGNTFEINFNDLSKFNLNNLETYLEEELDWIIQDYMSCENNIKEIIFNKNSITIKTDLEEGLYLTLLKQQLMERLGCLV